MKAAHLALARLTGFVCVVGALAASCGGRAPNMAVVPAGDAWWCYSAFGQFVDKQKEAAGLYVLGVVPADASHTKFSQCLRSSESCETALDEARSSNAEGDRKQTFGKCARQDRAACWTSKRESDSDDKWLCFDGMSDCEWFRDATSGSNASKDYEYISRCEWLGAK